MKRGFTLIELLVVVGIMAMLGVAATSGYAALQRGMAERGAVATVNSLLKAAKERSKVDRVPVRVFFYNKLITEGDSDNNAVVVGEAVAVRRAGRISFVQNKLLYDEFADLAHTYDVESSESRLRDRGAMKLWRFYDSQGNNQMQYSLVADAVMETDDTGVQVGFFGDEPSSRSNATIRACAFYEKDDANNHKPGNWKAGDGYGFEFATVQLPHNFIFGSSGVPSSVDRVQEVDAAFFDPEQDSDKQIDIYFCMPSGSGFPQPHHKAGAATSKENATS